MSNNLVATNLFATRYSGVIHFCSHARVAHKG